MISRSAHHRAFYACLLGTCMAAGTGIAPTSALASELSQLKEMSARLGRINEKLVNVRLAIERIPDCNCNAKIASTVKEPPAKTIQTPKPVVVEPPKPPLVEPRKSDLSPKAPVPPKTVEQPKSPLVEPPKSDLSPKAPVPPKTIEQPKLPEVSKPNEPIKTPEAPPVAKVKPPPPPPVIEPIDEGLPLIPIAGAALALIILIIALIALKKRLVPVGGNDKKNRISADQIVAEELARSKKAKAPTADHDSSGDSPAPPPVAAVAPASSLSHRPVAVAVARPSLKPLQDTAKPVELPSLSMPELPPATEGDSGAPPVIPEADQALELAEVMISMGLAKGAAETLVEHIRANPKKALYHWLKLLDIYKKTGNKEEFINSSNDLRRYFNIQADEAQTAGSPQSMEDYTHLMAKIVSLWRKPECVDFLARLLDDNRGGTRQGFPTAIAEEILLMISVLRHED